MAAAELRFMTKASPLQLFRSGDGTHTLRERSQAYEVYFASEMASLRYSMVHSPIFTGQVNRLAATRQVRSQTTGVEMWTGEISRRQR